MNGKEIGLKLKETGEKIWDKAKDIGSTAIEKGKDGIKWVIENPDKAAALTAFGAAAAGGASKVLRGIHRNVTVKREIYDRQTRFYDHSAGRFVYSKRPLKGKEMAKFDRMKRESGKKTSEILEEMGLLKR